MNDTAMSRREMLGATATAAVAVMTRPVHARPIGANDRIGMAVIGVGGMGSGHLGGLLKRADSDNLQVRAVCDVYQRRLARAMAAASCEGDRDYRTILDRPDIDAILIATPDHWHAKIAIDAMEAGKHVYVEKPMTHTVEQALALRAAVKKTGKILEVGPQATGDDGYWQAAEAIRAGRIGKVTWAQGSYNRNARVCLFNTHQKIDPTAGPDRPGDDFIDWDMWLGHKWGLAPQIPWNPEHFFRFRKYWPYNGGVATDLLYHKLAPLLIALAGPDGQQPLRVSATGGLYIEKDGRDIPDTFLLTIDYPGEFSVFLVSTLTNDTQLPDRIYGKHGTIDLGGDPVLKANGDFADEFKAANGGAAETKLTRSPRPDQVGNFLGVVRGEGTLHCNVDLGCNTMIAIKLGVESYRQRKSMNWDPQAERLLA
jgi:predicted dehydrogenase